MKSFFILSKTALWSLTLAGMYFTAHFWMGSQDAWEYQVEHDPLAFFFSRLAVTMLVGLFFMLFHWLVNRQLGKGMKLSENLDWIDFWAIAGIAVVLIWLSM